MKVVKGIAIVIIALASIAAVVLIAINMKMLHSESGTMNAFIDRQDDRYAESQKKETEFIEDGAVIGDTYTIKSTKAISDAYVNGQDPSGLSEEDKKTYDLAVKTLDEATKGKNTLYEKELGVFEWLAKNVSHDADQSTRAVLVDEVLPQDTPYGVLTTKTAVCVGYATTFRLLMNMLGAEVHIPHNDSHSWDLVKLDDNEWYLTDIYSAASSGNGNIDYQYFNNNEITGSDRFDLSMMSNLPRANGKKYLYQVQTAQDVKDFYELPKYLKKAIKKKQNVLSLRFGTKPTEEEILMGTSVVESAQSRITENNTDLTSAYFTGVWCRDENDNFIFTIYIVNNADSSGRVDPNSPEAKKMRDALDKAFGTTSGYDPLATEDNTPKTETETYTYSSNEAA